jgi:hypothetical protein
MKKFTLILAALATVCFASQSHSQGTSTPLHLYTSGNGSVTPLQDGDLLVIGQTYDMEAIPCSDSVFSSWQPVNVTTVTQFDLDANGNPVPIYISIVPSPVPDYSYQPILEFTMQPNTVIADTPTLTIVQSYGWQANFAPVPEPTSLALIACGLTAILFGWSKQFRNNNHVAQFLHRRHPTQR